ncbi:MAG: prephenate dehydratase [Osedax symbiont Rs2]|nr:MAG: prephenate dehydratase [Osedax symbiont Rs2]
MKMHDFSCVVENINDYSNNQTRFLLFAGQPNNTMSDQCVEYKTSLIVLDDDDQPGYLEGILSKFTKRQINLTSIASRPTRQTFGKYHFFIDLDGHQLDANVSAALVEIQQTYKVRVLGSYPKASGAGKSKDYQ